MPDVGEVTLPAEGALTFLFTDIEGSTRKAHQLGEDWFTVLEMHHAVLRPIFAAHGGLEVSTAGDSFFVVFTDAAQAVAATIAMQYAIRDHDWSPAPPVKVRMGLHTGLARFRAHDNDYAGLTVHAASRVESAAAGAQVLITQATLDAAADAWPDGVETIDLGFHRLKDLPTEVRLYQLVADGLPREFPPVRGLELARNNVPVPPSTFVGRTAVLTRLHRMLDEDRVVTVVGVGGTGKTRVAVQLATERLPRHADGVWFAELAAATDARGVVGAIAEALGVKEDPAREPLDSLVDFVRDRDVLLVVDNCEHVIDDAASVIETLVKAGHLVRVLATSREPLEIDGERVWPLTPLDVDGDDGGEAVALLVDRIRLVEPDFELTDDDRSVCVNIARRLDGLPLAVELAAASAATLALSEIAAQLDARFGLLTKGKRNAADRQKTLRGAIDWSYGLLSEDEQRLFRRLGVFPSEFDFGVVQQVCGDDVDIDAALFALQRKSLVSDSPSARLRCLESIRAYARDALEENGELAQWSERHARAFVGPIIEGTDDDWVTTVSDDLLAARRWGCEYDRQVELLALDALQAVWVRKGQLREGRELSAETLHRVDDALPKVKQRALSKAAHLAILQGDTEAGRAYYIEAAELAQRANLGDDVTTLILADLARVELMGGDVMAATARYRDALALARRSKQDHLAALALAHLAEMSRQTGDLRDAWNFANEAIQLARAEGIHQLELNVGILLGVIAMQRGELGDARATFRDALAMAQKFDVAQPVVYLRYCLATVELDAGDPSSALPHLREALTLALEIGATPDLAEGLEAAGRAVVMLGRAGDAAALVATATAIRERIGFARDPSAAAAFETLRADVPDAPPLGDDEAVAAALALFDSLAD